MALALSTRERLLNKLNPSNLCFSPMFLQLWPCTGTSDHREGVLSREDVFHKKILLWVFRGCCSILAMLFSLFEITCDCRIQNDTDRARRPEFWDVSADAGKMHVSCLQGYVLYSMQDTNNEQDYIREGCIGSGVVACSEIPRRSRWVMWSFEREYTS